MKVDSDGQRGTGHRHQGVRFVCRVEWNSSDSLMNRKEQERAHTCSEMGQGNLVVRIHCTLPACVNLAVSLTLTGLLPRLQAVSSSAHAGPGCWRGRQTQLGAVSIVVTAQVDTSYREMGQLLDRSQFSMIYLRNF